MSNVATVYLRDSVDLDAVSVVARSWRDGRAEQSLWVDIELDEAPFYDDWPVVVDMSYRIEEFDYVEAVSNLAARIRDELGLETRTSVEFEADGS